MRRHWLAVAGTAIVCTALPSTISTAHAAPSHRKAAATHELVWVTAFNTVREGVPRADGSMAKLNRIGPATKAPAHHTLQIQSLKASADGNWVAWVEQPVKKTKFGPDYSPRESIVLHDQQTGKSTILTGKYGALLGFVHDQLHVLKSDVHATVGAIVLAPTPHVVKTRISSYASPLAVVKGGIVETYLADRRAKRLHIQIRLQPPSGKPLILHTYVIPPSSVRSPDGGWVSGDSNGLIIENGDHTDFGGVGPSSHIDLFTRGGLKFQHLGHFGTAKAQWRVQDIGFSGKHDQPWGAFTSAATPSVAADVGRYVDGAWQVVAGHAIAFAVDSSNNAVVEGGKYVPVKSQGGPEYRTKPSSDAVLIHRGKQTRLTGVQGTQFVWAG
jgi:hypothetical protein